MPSSPREISDQMTTSRLRRVIRHILQQKVRRLSSTDSGLQTQITANAANIATALIKTETAYASAQVWAIPIASYPIQVTLWNKAFLSAAKFDDFQFDSVQFDEGFVTQTLTTATVVYTAATQSLSLDWGSAKSGTVYILNHDSDTAFSVIAVTD